MPKLITQLTTLFAFALLLAACGKSKSYTIYGEVPDVVQGNTVRLEASKGNLDDTEVVGYATIENETFTFKGKVTEPFVATVVCETEGGSFHGIVFVEPGEINFLYDPKNGWHGEGTPLNDKYVAHTVKLFDTAKQIRDLRKKAKKGNYTEKQLKVANVQEQCLRNAELTYIKDEIKANSDNVFGLYLVTQNMGKFNMEERETLIGYLPEKFKASPEVALMIKEIEAYKNTAVGQHYSDFDLMDTYGDVRRLSRLIDENKVTILHFWTSYNNKSGDELAILKQAYEKYKDQGLGLVGIGVERDGNRWVDTINKYDIPWIQLSDLQGFKNEAALKYAVSSYPNAFIFDANGIIVARDLKGEAILEELSKLLD